MAKNKGGRPKIVDDAVIQKLEQAYANDMTDLEACLYAGISKSTLYNYQNDNPEFLERKEMLKNALSLKAKNVIANSINKGNEADAKWWLERRRKSEFSIKNETELYGKGGQAISIDLTQKVLEKLPTEELEALLNESADNK